MLRRGGDDGGKAAARRLDKVESGADCLCSEAFVMVVSWVDGSGV